MPRGLSAVVQWVNTRRAIASVAALGALALSLAAPVAVRAQGLIEDSDPRRAEVLLVVTKLFDGMRAADSASVRALFHPSATLMTTAMRDGVPTASGTPIAPFLASIGTPRPDALDERTMNERVYLDGNLAMVWTDYEMFIGSRFSHCGVDVFTLARTADGWQIMALADTRRREGCAGR